MSLTFLFQWSLVLSFLVLFDSRNLTGDVAVRDVDDVVLVVIAVVAVVLYVVFVVIDVVFVVVIDGLLFLFLLLLFLESLHWILYLRRSSATYVFDLLMELLFCFVFFFVDVLLDVFVVLAAVVIAVVGQFVSGLCLILVCFSSRFFGSQYSFFYICVVAVFLC